MKQVIHRHQRGQSLVEFALIVIVLFMLLLGLVDFGLSFYTLVTIRNAVAEGGYYASQHPKDDAGVRQHIEQELSKLNPPVLDADINIVCNPSPIGAEQTTVSMSYQHPLLFNYLIPNASVRLGASTYVPQMGGC